MPAKTVRTKRKSTQKSRENLAGVLDQLEIAQLVRHLAEDEPAYIFKHTLIQETTYQTLLQKQRREIHRHVAAAYQAEFRNQCLDEFAGILAHHYAEAGDDEQTLVYAKHAGDVASQMYANAEATQYFALAITAAMRLNVPTEALQELYLKRGRAFELQSHFDDAARNYDEMEKTAGQRGERAFELAAQMALATVRAIPGSARDTDQARAIATEALNLARELGDRKAEAKIYWILSVANVYSGGNNAEAIANGEHSLAIARELNLREQMAFSLHDLFVAYAYSGNLDRARDARLEAAQLWRELDNKPMLSENVTGMGVFHYLLGEYDQALATSREGYQLSQQIGNLGGQGFSGLVTALTHIQLGEYAQALRSFDDVVPIVDLGGLEGNGMSLLGLRAWVHACLGDIARAREFLQRALSLSTSRLPYQGLYLYALWMHIELLAGNVAEAERIKNEGAVTQNAEQFERMFPPSAHIIYLASSELELAQGDFDRALTTLNELLVCLERRRTRANHALVLWHKGRALDGLNRTDEASQVWAQALAEAESLRERRVVYLILGSLIDSEARRGSVAQAKHYRARAHEIVEYILDHMPTEFRQSFLNTPGVRKVIPE